MKFLKLSHDLITDTNITSNEFRIYTYLLSLYNENKKCAYPSIETISNRLNISVATVKRSIKRLVELGYMIIEKKKSVAGNYNTYKELKHLIKNVADTTKKVVKNVFNKVVNERKPVIVSDCKESGVQLEIEELTPYSMEHQQKISLVLKSVKNLTEKQMFLIGDMDLETLRNAIFRFKKSTKTNTFAFLVECYYTECSLNGVVPSKDLQRYTGNIFIPVSEEYLENKRIKELMIEEGLFDEVEWSNQIVLGL